MNPSERDMFAYNKATTRLLEYWESLPKPEGYTCPYRTDFRMMDVSEISSNVFLDERHSDEVVCVVQTGERLTNILGVDVTGHNIIMLLPEDEFPLEREYYRALYEHECAGHLARVSKDIRGREFIYKTTHLPLLGSDNTIRFWVGTGSEIEGHRGKNNDSQIKFSGIQLLEREYFDLGRGVPTQKMADLPLS